MNVIATWQNSYSVGIKMFDKQHMELINLTNKLYSSCFENKDLSNFVFLDTIHDTVDYVKYHFGTEEKVMEKLNYPKFKEHKSEHADFVRQVFARVNDFRSGKANTSIAFVRFLKDWILHHIAVCDKEMGKFVIEKIKSTETQNKDLNIEKPGK